MPLLDKEQVKILVDSRELKGKVVQELFNQKVQLDVRTLQVADYIVSDRVAFEYKTASDFEASIMDTRLFNQCEQLIDNFDKPVLIIQGTLMTGRIHPNAIRGAIASITTDYGIPVITVDTPEEAAHLIIAYARREQGSPDRNIKYDTKKKGFTTEQQQEAIISSIPSVGVKLAKELLKQFKTIKNVINATAEELASTPLIGKAKAERINKIINKEYN